MGLISLIIIVFLLIFLHTVSGFLRGGNNQIRDHFDSAGYSYEIHEEQIRNREIGWIATGTKQNNRAILFLHGAPGSWKDFSQYLIDPDLQQSMYMIAMDRPGYGYSDYGNAETSIIEQVEIAHAIVQQYEIDSLLVVGYSYGGPIAGSYASRYPEKIFNLLLLAPVIAPYHEKIFWFNNLIEISLIKSLLPKFIRVANDEKLGHTKALIAIKNDWTMITVPAIHLHCMDDWIAPYEANVSWSQEHIPDVTIVDWEGDSHFLPNNVYDRIKPVIMTMISQQ